MPELPKTLDDAIAQSQIAVQAALADGVARMQVEFLFPELKAMPVAQQFLPVLAEYGSRLNVFFPDAGAAALARRDWVDEIFRISDIGTGKASIAGSKIQPEEEIFLFVAPTSVEVPQLEKICAEIGDRPIIMLNPRLEDSGVVGIGFAARQTRERFISTIESCYYLRPVDDETALFRCYPGLWEIWVETNNQYQKIAELPTKPSGDDIDMILAGGQPNNMIDNGEVTPTRKNNIFRSLQRFLKALSS